MSMDDRDNEDIDNGNKASYHYTTTKFLHLIKTIYYTISDICSPFFRILSKTSDKIFRILNSQIHIGQQTVVPLHTVALFHQLIREYFSLLKKSFSCMNPVTIRYYLIKKIFDLYIM